MSASWKMLTLIQEVWELLVAWFGLTDVFYFPGFLSFFLCEKYCEVSVFSLTLECPASIQAVRSSSCRYLDNIYLHPEEEKYRKIKLQNKVFQVSSGSRCCSALESPCLEQTPPKSCPFPPGKDKLLGRDAQIFPGCWV